MQKILFLLFSLFTANTLFAQANIAEARTYAQGANLTITGIVTHGSSLGPIRYLQDDTGGIPVYDPPVTTTWNPGDEVTVTGSMGMFNGLIQVANVSNHTVNSSGNALPTPQVVSPNGLNADTEAELVELQGIVFEEAGATFTVGERQFTQTSTGESGITYVRANHPLLCTPIPVGEVNLTGIVSVFNGTYQLLLRDPSDVTGSGAAYINQAPAQTNITNTGFTLAWQTSAAADHAIRYGLTPDLELGEVQAGTNSMEASYTFTNLDPAAFYYAQAYSTLNGEMIEAGIKLYSTASNSSGTIDVYFNNIVDGSVSSGTIAKTKYGPDMLQFFKDQINAAQSTIDVQVYNNNRNDLTAALTAAHERGVVVRYITDIDEFNSGLTNPTPPFFVFRVQPATGLMHNKFMIIDAASTDDATVITGSMNWTNNNIGTDFNNVVVVQDEALAKAYTLEFEEMWGSSDATPGIFAARAGADKTDNTPHLFNIGGTLVELHFSPSDIVSCQLEDAVRSADSKIDFALLSFTYDGLGAAIVDEDADNVVVRGMMENTNDSGSEFSYLQSQGINVIDHPASGTIHHKYCIVDADAANSDPLVITGSHNWSVSAETRNDENTLIIHDESIANQFWQEFEARFAGLVGINAVPAIAGFDIKTFPNPAVEYLQFDFILEKTNDILIEIFDANGKPIQATQLANITGEYTHSMAVNHLASGSYFATFTMNGLTVSRMIQIVK